MLYHQPSTTPQEHIPNPRSQNCTFFLYCATPPEIEAATCHSLAFAPFNGNYPQLQENMAQAGLDPEGECLSRLLRLGIG